MMINFHHQNEAVAIVVIEFPQIIENWQQAKDRIVKHNDQK